MRPWGEGGGTVGAKADRLPAGLHCAVEGAGVHNRRTVPCATSISGARPRGEGPKAPAYPVSRPETGLSPPRPDRFARLEKRMVAFEKAQTPVPLAPTFAAQD